MLVTRTRSATLVLGLVALLIGGPMGMSTATAGSGIATLLVLAGAVSVSGGPATDGQTVLAGDEISTDSDGVALLTFFDGSETQLQPDTHVTLETPDGTPSGLGVSVYQSQGTTLNHVQHLAPNASFQTDTPTAVAMVRGTTYVVSVMRDSEAPAQDTANVAQDAPDAKAPTVGDVPSGEPASSQAPANDQTDQQAALVASAPLFEESSTSSQQCERNKPTQCMAAVVLLADQDGHVGHVEVASHIVGHPALHLTEHGAATHVSRAGAVNKLIKPEHLASLHAAALHLHDPARALKAHEVARHLVRTGVPRARPAHPTPAA